MSSIITDTSPASMARCVEENLVACFSLLAAPRNGVREDNGITTIVTGVPINDFNGVFRTRLPADLPTGEFDARVSATLRYLDGCGVPYAWCAMPSSQPPDLAQQLAARGLRRTEAPPGMAVDLQALNEEVAAPEGLVIEPVRDIAGLRTWVRTSFVGFGMPDALEEQVFAIFSQLDLSAEGAAQYFLGSYDGQPVATAVGVMAAGIVGLYTISTVAEHRGKGMGAAMTLAPLREARARGYRIGILEASKMGFPVYQRLGFRQYVAIERYTPIDTTS